MTNPFGEYLAKAAADPVVLCVGCRAQGRCRFGMIEYRRIAEGETKGTLACPAEHEGGPGTAHGGWIAAAMDEVLSMLPLRHGAFAVTKTMTIDYLKPIPVARVLECAARLNSRAGSAWHITGEIMLNGAVLARGTGIFVERDITHFQRFERWMDEQK